jgi:hypothetical protein
MVSEFHANGSRGRTHHTMALDQPALLEHPRPCRRRAASLWMALLRWLEPVAVEDTVPVINSRSASSSPVGYRFPREVIGVAVRWYLRYGLSYRDVEELLAERGVVVDHVTVYRWVQTFTPEFIDAARPARHAAGDR